MKPASANEANVSLHGALMKRTTAFSAMLPNSNNSVWSVFTLFAV